MIDDTVRLRPVSEGDLSMLELFMVDPEAAGPFAWFGWTDPGRFRRRWAENGMLSADGGYLMVTADTDTLGFVAWRKVVTVPHSYYWNMGIQLLPQAQGRGVGTQAQRLLARYLFAHTPAARIEAHTDVENIAEQRALEKAGFTREGVLRSVIFRDGRWRDSLSYSVLRDDAP
ncbi:MULTISPECIES: GNAT family protein [unclassified Streptomyces]|uniref:GNAT family N-acetyltransferase n=1 Tax=unclassified Streptomyces TaxID=2593676 RepID=UPI00332FD827